MSFREPAYAVLSAVLGMVTLILGMLAVFFVFAGIHGALNQAVPHGAERFNAIVICFAVAIVFAFVAVVCGRLTYKCMKVASRE
jgi:phosphotransferase system  glucose/maltose/N-acetylglucosamine-specific IIC component